MDSEYHGKWIRPITNLEHGVLMPNNIQYLSGTLPRVLDIIEISFHSYKPSFFQVENYLIDCNQTWKYLGGILKQDLERYCDSPVCLWENLSHSIFGKYDRIPDTIARRFVKTSLMLLSIQKIIIYSIPINEKRIIRCIFMYNNVKYNLPVTDPIIGDLFENGSYTEISLNNIYICVSLGEPFNSFSYKIVAAVII